MTRKFIGFSFLALLWIAPSLFADESVADKQHWGIGLQGNFPLWGGLSIKYMGLDRLHFQALEHYVQNGDEYSAMFGLQTPIVLVRYPWTRVYLAPGVGVRRQKEIQQYFVYSNPPTEPSAPIDRSVVETTFGGALLFGLEFFLDNIFTSSENSRYGLNIEFGQGIGSVNRDVTCADQDGTPVNCADVPDLQYLNSDPNEKEGTRFRASFVVGFGFHIYF